MRDRIIKVLTDYVDHVEHSELNSGMHIGCDCGCGGDYYSDNTSAYQALVDSDEAASKAYADLCKELGVYEEDLESLKTAVSESHEKPFIGDDGDEEYYVEYPERLEVDTKCWQECEDAVEAAFKELNLEFT